MVFLKMPRVCLQFVIVVFPGHTHYFYVNDMRLYVYYIKLYICLHEPATTHRYMYAYMDLNARKPVFGVGEQQRRRLISIFINQLLKKYI